MATHSSPQLPSLYAKLQLVSKTHVDLQDHLKVFRLNQSRVLEHLELLKPFLHSQLIEHLPVCDVIAAVGNDVGASLVNVLRSRLLAAGRSRDPAPIVSSLDPPQFAKLVTILRSFLAPFVHHNEEAAHIIQSCLEQNTRRIANFEPSTERLFMACLLVLAEGSTTFPSFTCHLTKPCLRELLGDLTTIEETLQDWTQDLADQCDGHKVEPSRRKQRSDVNLAKVSFSLSSQHSSSRGGVTSLGLASDSSTSSDVHWTYDDLVLMIEWIRSSSQVIETTTGIHV